MEKYRFFELSFIFTKEFLTVLPNAGALFCGLILGYSHFVLNWATNRMKDWEAAKPPKLGCPALVCWIAGVGELTAGLIGVHIFSALYVGLRKTIYYWHIPILMGMLVTVILLWIILLKFLKWYFDHGGDLSSLHETDLSQIVHWHTPLKWVVPFFIVTGLGSLMECCFGNPLAGLAGLFYELCGTFSIGAYCSLRGDLLPRACVESTIAPALNAAQNGDLGEDAV